MNELTNLLEFVGPTLVAITTVWLMDWMKRFVSLIDRLNPTLKRVVVILIAYGLTRLAQLVGTAVPTDLAAFTESDISALLSAAMAYAIHAGNNQLGELKRMR